MEHSDSHSLYVYCIVPVPEETKVDVIPVKGMDGKSCEMVRYRELAVVLCRLSDKEYSPEALEQKMTDQDWVTKNAMNHHEVIDYIHEHYPTLPMSFCMLFSSLEKLFAALEERYDEITKALAFFSNKDAWNIKIYCNQEAFRGRIQNEVQQDESIKDLSPGKQFIMKKKMSQIIFDKAEQEQEHFVKMLHEKLESLSASVQIHKLWKEAEHERETMVFNCSYLVPVSDTEGFIHSLEEFKMTYANDHEWNVSLSGPWPPYHFSKSECEW